MVKIYLQSVSFFVWDGNKKTAFVKAAFSFSRPRREQSVQGGTGAVVGASAPWMGRSGPAVDRIVGRPSR